jgi:hypothetical protein
MEVKVKNVILLLLWAVPWAYADDALSTAVPVLSATAESGVERGPKMNPSDPAPLILKLTNKAEWPASLKGATNCYVLSSLVDEEGGHRAYGRTENIYCRFESEAIRSFPIRGYLADESKIFGLPWRKVDQGQYIPVGTPVVVFLTKDIGTPISVLMDAAINKPANVDGSPSDEMKSYLCAQRSLMEYASASARRSKKSTNPKFLQDTLRKVHADFYRNVLNAGAKSQ